MLTTSALKFLCGLVQCAAVPFWRHLVVWTGVRTLEIAAMAVIFLCVFFVARRMMMRPNRRPWFEPLLAAFASVAVLYALKLLTGVVVFWLEAAFGAVSLALLVCFLGAGRTPWWRFVLSGAFAAAATCEGCIGAFGALFVFGFLALNPRLRPEVRPFAPVGWWLLGYALAVACGRLVLRLSLATLFLPPTPVVIFGFFVAGLAALPLVAVGVVYGPFLIRRVLLFWCSFVVTALAVAWVRGVDRRTSACEVFARMVLSELGERQVVVGGGALDFAVRAFLPERIRLVGYTAPGDREYLLKLFELGKDSRREALFLSDYYDTPEGQAAIAEWGVPAPLRSPFGVREALQTASTNPTPESVAAVAAYTNALSATVQPLSQSLDEMLTGFAEIPPEKHLDRMNFARAQIRRAWALGVGGLRLSATLLALDTMLGDGKAAEYDALTALFIDRDDPAANAVLGGIRLVGGRLDDAERYLRRSVEHGGGSSAYNNLAMTLIKTGRGAEAVTFAKRAIEMEPTDWNVHETLAQAQIAAGDVAAAEAALEAMCDVAHGPEQAYKARKCADRDCTRLIEQVRAKGGEPAVRAFAEFRERLEAKLKAAEKRPGE